jgi:hypothetical protein
MMNPQKLLQAAKTLRRQTLDAALKAAVQHSHQPASPLWKLTKRQLAG